MVKPNVGVPQRIPQQIGDLCYYIVGHIVVQKHEVKVGVRCQFSAPKTPGRDDGESTTRRDTDFRSLGFQP